MTQILIGVSFVLVIGWATFQQLRNRELRNRIEEIEANFARELDESNARLEKTQQSLAKLEKYRSVPDLFEKIEYRKSKANETLKSARMESERMIQAAVNEAEQQSTKILSAAKLELEAMRKHIDANRDVSEKMIRNAQSEARRIIELAESEAKIVTSEARRNATEKTKKVDELLEGANTYVRQVRIAADQQALAVSGKAWEALKRYEFYSQARAALKKEVNQHLIEHMAEGTSLLDDWALEFGFHEAGQMLKFARKRTKNLIERDLAGETNYKEPLKRQFAIHFLRDAFDGKVEGILSKAKPDNFGKLKKEVIDAFVVINANGRAFETTRLTEEYRDSRVDELKWACVIQKIRARNRDEQRAIRERIRDEQRAKKEYEKALKQAKRDEEMLAKALEKVRRQYENSAAEDRAAYLEKIGDLEAKLVETEGYIRRTQSLAELTKQGHVYIISNLGSFGSEVFKIGLTRRLDPTDRITELGDASVPFRFDIHACIWSEDAPALEYALHKAFLDRQLNKVNKRKEFFRVSIQEIRKVVESMGLEAQWTMEAAAAEYRESLALENAMKEDQALRNRWLEEQLKFDENSAFDEDEKITADEVDLIG